MVYAGKVEDIKKNRIYCSFEKGWTVSTIPKGWLVSAERVIICPLQELIGISVLLIVGPRHIHIKMPKSVSDGEWHTFLRGDWLRERVKKVDYI